MNKLHKIWKILVRKCKYKENLSCRFLIFPFTFCMVCTSNFRHKNYRILSFIFWLIATKLNSLKRLLSFSSGLYGLKIFYIYSEMFRHKNTGFLYTLRLVFSPFFTYFFFQILCIEWSRSIIFWGRSFHHSMWC